MSEVCLSTLNAKDNVDPLISESECTCSETSKGLCNFHLGEGAEAAPHSVSF